MMSKDMIRLVLCPTFGFNMGPSQGPGDFSHRVWAKSEAEAFASVVAAITKRCGLVWT